MKQLFSILFTLCLLAVGHAQTINISTGMGTIGTIDTWKVGLASPTTANAYVIPQHSSGLWQVPPASSKWISVSAAGTGAGRTNFIYEKNFSVPANRKQLNYDLDVAADDELKKIELVKPNGTAINIPFITTTSYKFTKHISSIVDCPDMGDWKLRITVFCGDNSFGPTGLLVSGTINLTEGACTIPLPNNTCCPPFNTAVLRQTMVYKGTGGIGDPYTLVWNPNNTVLLQIQAYVNYLHILKPCINSMAIEFRLHNQGTGNLPITTSWGPQIGGIGYINFTANSTGQSSVVNSLPVNFFPANAMQPGTWYAITTGMYHNECGLQMFNIQCAENTIYVRLQVMGLKGGSGTPILEFSDGKKLITQEAKPNSGRG